MTHAPAGWYADPIQPNTQRYWNGIEWTPQTAPVVPVPPAAVAAVRAQGGNAAATAALVFGVAGFVLTPIPLFIGLILGGPLDVLAVVLGIVGIIKGTARGGAGVTRAVVGLVLGGLMLLAIPMGAGTIW